jgi:hypothetical protein
MAAPRRARAGLALAAAVLLLVLPAAHAGAARRLLRGAAPPAPAVGNAADAKTTMRRLSQISNNIKEDLAQDHNIIGIPKTQAAPGYMGKVLAPTPAPPAAPKPAEPPKEASAAAAGSAAADAAAAPSSLGAGQQPRSLPGAGPDAAAPVAQRGPGDLPAGALAPVAGPGGREAAFHDAHGNPIMPRESAFAANGAAAAAGAAAAPAQKGLDAAPPKDAQVKWVQFGSFGQIGEFSERPKAGP